MPRENELTFSPCLCLADGTRCSTAHRLRNLVRRLVPRHQFGHQPWRLKWCCGLKNNADLHPVFIECGDTVRMGLVLSPVARILFAMSQQDLVELLDMMLIERDVLSRVEH